MMHRLLLSIATLVLALAAERAPAAAPEPLAIDLHNNLWTGDLDVLIRHRAIRVLVPYSKTLYFVDYGGTVLHRLHVGAGGCRAQFGEVRCCELTLSGGQWP